MKSLKISLLVLVCMLISSAVSFASTPETNKADALLKDKVAKMIKMSDLSALDQILTEAVVEFIVTNEQEILVTKVNTKSNYLETVIKERLNYQTVSIDGVKRNRPYSLKVTFKKHV